MIKRPLVFFIFLFLFASQAFSFQQSSSNSSREEVISQELDCVSQSLNQQGEVTWEDVCSTSDWEKERKRQQLVAKTLDDVAREHQEYFKDVKEDIYEPGFQDKVEQGLHKGFHKVDYLQEENVGKKVGRRIYGESDDVNLKNLEEDSSDPTDYFDIERSRTIELALQVAAYHYETKDSNPYFYSQIYPVGNDAEKNSNLTGVYGSYTWHIFSRPPLQKWTEVFKHSPWPDFVRLEGDISLGKLEYKSYVTGKLDDIDAWQTNVRCLLGLDFPSYDGSFVLSPYLGVGYRRFTDKAGAWEDFMVLDHVEFPVKHSYYYLPVGIEALKHMNDNWDVVFKIEGDALLGGGIKFELSEIPGPLNGIDENNQPVQVYLSDTVSDLDGGFGLKTSFKLIKKYNDFNIFVEPFFGFWRVNQTKPEQEHARGVNGGDYVSVLDDGITPYKPVFEPLNYTTEFGLRLGAQF